MLDSVKSSLDDVLELRVVLVSEVGDQMSSLGAMETSVQFDVSVKIPFKGRALDLAFVEGLDDLGEHLGNGVLPAEEELACSVGDRLEDSTAGILVELLHVGRAIRSINSLLNVLIGVLIVSHLADLVDVVLHGLGIGSDLIHGLDVELKVGEVLPVNIGLIGLLSDDDFVDKPGSIDVCAGGPEPSGIGDVPLEILDEEEEIPNSEAMSLHEEPGGFNGVDCSIEGVGMESGLMFLENWIV